MITGIERGADPDLVVGLDGCTWFHDGPIDRRLTFVDTPLQQRTGILIEELGQSGVKALTVQLSWYNEAMFGGLHASRIVFAQGRTPKSTRNTVGS